MKIGKWVLGIAVLGLFLGGTATAQYQPNELMLHAGTQSWYGGPAGAPFYAYPNAAIGKYYPDTYPVHSPSECSPCGLLVTSCDHGPLGAGKCMEAISPQAVLERTKEVYEQWRSRKQKTA